MLVADANGDAVVRVTRTDNNDIASILPPGFVMLLVLRSVARSGSPSLARDAPTGLRPWGASLARSGDPSLAQGRAKSLAFGKIEAMSHYC